MLRLPTDSSLEQIFMSIPVLEFALVAVCWERLLRARDIISVAGVIRVAIMRPVRVWFSLDSMWVSSSDWALCSRSIKKRQGLPGDQDLPENITTTKRL